MFSTLKYTLNNRRIGCACPVTHLEREVAMIHKLIENWQFIERMLTEDWQFSWLSDDL